MLAGPSTVLTLWTAQLAGFILEDSVATSIHTQATISSRARAQVPKLEKGDSYIEGRGRTRALGAPRACYS